jgi:phage gp36-like protein
MSYSAVSDIIQDFKAMAIDSDTAVTDAAVTQFIVEADALINSYVGQKYQVPVTGGGDGLNLLKLCSRSLVSNRVRAIMQVKQPVNTDPAQNVSNPTLSKTDVMQILKDIREGNLNLDGATLLGSTSGGFTSQNVNNMVCPTIRKDSIQW